MIDMERATHKQCVACGTSMANKSPYFCTKCKSACDITMDPARARYAPRPAGTPFLVNVLSKCCGADVIANVRQTCSAACHELLVVFIESAFGAYKKVVRGSTGEAFKVPTRVIIEHGLIERDLDRYPIWEGE